MKRILCIFIAVLMVLTMSACETEERRLNRELEESNRRLEQAAAAVREAQRDLEKLDRMWTNYKEAEAKLYGN